MKQSDLDFVRSLGNACDPAMEFLNSQPTMQKAWENCEDAGHMLWYLQRILKPGSENYCKMVLAVVDIVQWCGPYTKDDIKKYLAGLRALTRAWARNPGGKTEEKCHQALDSACKPDDANSNEWLSATIATRYATYFAVPSNWAYKTIVCLEHTRVFILEQKGIPVGTMGAAAEEMKLLKKQAAVFHKYFPKLPKSEL